MTKTQWLKLDSTVAVVMLVLVTGALSFHTKVTRDLRIECEVLEAQVAHHTDALGGHKKRQLSIDENIGSIFELLDMIQDEQRRLHEDDTEFMLNIKE